MAKTTRISAHPCIHENTLYVPIQAPRGVWRINLTNAEQSWLHPSDAP